MFALLPKRRGVLGSTWVSVAAHAAVVAAFVFVLRLHPVRVFNLPGTPAGTHVELAYLPGRAPAPPVPKKIKTKAPIPAKVVPPAPPAPTPDANNGSDSWGSGSVEIALTTYSPSPAPDLSVLPHGVQGDVIVDVTIDPDGKVADLAVLHTLGYGIESSVIGTLKTWTFRPAKKDGSPIASVQELHFHFGPV
jgi:protein TonB